MEQIIKEENLEVGVVSFGGCGSNALVRTLTANGIVCATPIWHERLCHYPTVPDSEIKFIYLHRNLRDAFISQKYRGSGIWDVNQRKLSGDPKIELSDENLIRLMKEQYYNWTTSKNPNILVISYETLFTPESQSKIETHIGKKLINYPKFKRIEFKFELDPKLEDLFLTRP